MPFDQRRIVEQTKFTYSPLSKAFEKQIKAIEDQGIKQVKALKYFKTRKKPRTRINWLRTRTNESKYEIDEIKK